MKNYKYQLIWFLLSIVSFFYVFGVYNNITKLENNKNAIISGIICNKHCKIKGQSTMTVEYKQKKYIVNSQRESCRKYNIQDRIKLIYDKKNDNLLRTNESVFYKKKLLMIIISIILSLFPWYPKLTK